MPTYFFASNIKSLISLSDINLQTALIKMGIEAPEFYRLMRAESLKTEIPFVEELLPMVSTYLCVPLNVLGLENISANDKQELYLLSRFNRAISEPEEWPITRNEFAWEILKTPLSSIDSELGKFLLCMQQRYLANKFEHFSQNIAEINSYNETYKLLKEIFISSSGDF